MQKYYSVFSVMFVMSALRYYLLEPASCSQVRTLAGACSKSICAKHSFTNKNNATHIDCSDANKVMMITPAQQKKSMYHESTHCCHSSSFSSFHRKSSYALRSIRLPLASSSSSSSSLFCCLHSSSTAFMQQCQHYSTPGKVKVTIITSDQTDLDLESDCNVSLMSFIRDCELFTEVCCTGVMHCGTCHVYVDPAWMSKVGKPSEEEQDMLDQCPDPKETSRLSCQIELTEELDGLHVTLPEHTVNLMYTCPANTTDNKK